MPRPRELAPLVRFERPFPGLARRLARAQTIWDLRELARKRTPRVAFDYTDGAADEEITLRRARQAFEDIEFRPAILRNVAETDTTTTVLGKPAALPFGIAPTGFTRMMRTEGEIAGARAAERAGIPFALSTMATTAIEDLAAATGPGARNWFQLYMWKDRERSLALVDRAARAGFDTLLVTVDVPVGGARLRDARNGMTVPPSITLGGALDALRKPRWWWDFLTTEPLAFASLDRWSGTVGQMLDAMFDPTVGFDDLVWLRERWPGRVVVKGVQTVADAKRLAGLGVDGIVLSNHGGRQLDRAPVPLQLLPAVRAEVGDDLEIHLDTGIMHGGDIVAALALGARFTLIGRAYLYGLMAGGEPGVDRAIEILRSQLIRTMKLLGVSAIEELGPAHVRLLDRARSG
ncbi:alpha-hydroxy-acid oxidizing protein [Nocardia sp. CDC159]|uniref:Alpha-hydroxy-acid oxidizing protein n=1 Tax=Nocardia pulmonis TaxID=2951408 RepID=A0A9X2IZP7_9NOCA|nr:alpha-hydroxy-acid oxidizing protein [Nocardia pulmonis]MCM6791262.1 alpha-hydroxy-acid oxidizing protein [Nocardia sp. CDC159]